LVKIKTGLGLDCHRFHEDPSIEKPFVLGGVHFESDLSLKGNSDADVILHAITDAISSITGNTIIGAKADELCQQGITDSREYLKLALADLEEFTISHVAIALECKQPKIDPMVEPMRISIAELLGIAFSDVGITATSGEALSDVGRGLGIHCTVILTVVSK
jgi:2-C-methyl-D-erythritol 2,4-cyclodiphosphate synthase